MSLMVSDVPPEFEFAINKVLMAQIAENHLSPQAKAAVKNLLGSDTLIKASTWPDEIRSDSDWTHADNLLSRYIKYFSQKRRLSS